MNFTHSNNNPKKIAKTTKFSNKNCNSPFWAISDCISAEVSKNCATKKFNPVKAKNRVGTII